MESQEKEGRTEIRDKKKTRKTGVRRVGGHWAWWQQAQSLMRGEPEEKWSKDRRGEGSRERER